MDDRPQPQSQPQQQPDSSVDDWEHNQLRKLRRYLLLLASLAATVTYAAGLDPPGGSWVESDDEMMAVAGDSILRATHHRRYLAFYYSNATAFAASLVVILLLLVLADKNRPLDTTVRFPFLWRQTTHLRVLRLVMVLDLLALMVAYTAGSCREKVATIYTAALVAALFAYVGIHHIVSLVDGSSPDQKAPPPSTSTDTDLNLEQPRKVLMLLAIFAATITYNAGLNPPGGFWEHANGLHRPGEEILKHKHGGRFAVFFFCNTAAFIASLFTVVLLLDKKLTASATLRLRALYGFVVVTLVALAAAYAAGSCRDTATTTYTVALVAAVLVSIVLAAVAACTAKRFMKWLRKWLRKGFRRLNGDGPDDESLNEKKSLILLLGTLAASITYQAGLNPPGGVWLENQQSSSGSHGHIAGDPILLNTDHKRYSIFFYCNSTALVASIIVILMVQIKALLKRNALHTAIMFDLFGLMGAYIAGSSRTLRASVHVIVMAAAFLVYVSGTYLYVKMTSPSNNDNIQNPDAESRRLKKRRKRLLLFAILMAAITYQAGLSPPGGFWRVEQGHSSVGSPILEDMYPRRYKAFFYCNAMSFMASMALIILLQDDKTCQSAGIRFYGLYACMLVGMLVLMSAYAAGTARRLRTSIYVFVLVGGVSVFIALLLALFVLIRRQEHEGASSSTPTPTTPGGRQSPNANGGSTAGRNNDDDTHRDRQSSNAANASGTAENNNDDVNHRRRGEGGHAKRKYVMLLAMLAASVTYQAGLDPPGGVWPEGYAAGSPVLHDSNLRRYHVFFYSNSSSFVASIVVIMLLLQSELRNMPSHRHGPQQHNVQRGDDPILLMATNTVVALDLVGLLVAYAAGSSRTLETSLYVIVLVVAVVIYIVVHVGLPGEGTSNTQGASGERLNGANGQQAQAV